MPPEREATALAKVFWFFSSEKNALPFRHTLSQRRIVKKRSFSLAGHRTSIALEGAFWMALEDIARTRGLALAALVAGVDAAREPGQNLASALRVLALMEARAAVATGIEKAPRD